MEKSEIKFKRGDLVYKETYFGPKIRIVNGETAGYLLLGNNLWIDESNMIHYCFLSPKQEWQLIKTKI